MSIEMSIDMGTPQGSERLRRRTIRDEHIARSDRRRRGSSKPRIGGRTWPV